MKPDPKKTGKSRTAQIAKIVNRPIDPINEKILKIIFDKKEISIPDLAAEMNLHPSSVATTK